MDSMEKRTLIAVLLTLVVLIGYQFMFTKPVPQTPQKAETGTKTEREATKKETPSPVVPAPPAEVSVAARDIKVETELYAATLTSRGGTIKGFQLRRYKDKNNGDVTLLKAPDAYPAPLAVGLSTENFELSRMNFSVHGSDQNLKGAETGSLIFEYSSPSVTIRRTYTFHGDRYTIDVSDEVAGLPEYWITLGSDFGIYDSKDSSIPHFGPVILKDTERIELNTKKFAETQSYRGGLRWVAEEDKYFCAALIPSGQEQEAKAWKAGDSVLVAFKAKAGRNNFIVYAGPKEYDRLSALHVGLEHIIDFGFFSILARPLFWLLKFFYSFLGNYGWAIVLLTVIVRIPFIPLVNKGQKSMRQLQAIQPKLTEIREKYKKDPQRMQKETMEMYKKYKVNPMGGCLPMLLQIPVFFALYKVLMTAIELRDAPFILWIRDLSGPDTLFGHIPASFPLIGGFAIGPLPIAMGITMVIQQKMTPSSLDPAQNKMMMLMPVVFTFLFLNFASGLVLYWLVNNVFSIAQQYYTNARTAKQPS